MEESSPPTGRSMMGKSIAFSSRRGCHRKRSKPERSGWRDAFTLLARSLAGSQTRAPASGGIFPGIWATCWRTFRTPGRRGIRVSNCRHCGWGKRLPQSSASMITRFAPEQHTSGRGRFANAAKLLETRSPSRVPSSHHSLHPSYNQLLDRLDTICDTSFGISKLS